MILAWLEIQHSITDQAINQWQNRFNVHVKAKGQTLWTFVEMRLSVTVNLSWRLMLALLWLWRLTHVVSQVSVMTFIKRGGHSQFCHCFVANSFRYLCTKNYQQYNVIWQSYWENKEGAVFFCLTVYSLECTFIRWTFLGPPLSNFMTFFRLFSTQVELQNFSEPQKWTHQILGLFSIYQHLWEPWIMPKSKRISCLCSTQW